MSETFQLETSRLFLRPFRDDDLQDFCSYRSDPQVAEYQGWEWPYDAEKAQRFLEEMQRTTPGTPGQWYQLALERKRDAALLGDAAFRLDAGDPRQVTIGITLARPYQSQGYAREAAHRLLSYLFDDLKVHRVRADTDVENLASVRLLERLGFRREAHFVESLWFKGRWASEYWYALLEQEWRATTAK